MPKAKPDQVIIHRIELQEREREMLDSFIMTMNVKNLGSGLGAIIGSLSNASIAGTILLGSVWAAIMLEIEGAKSDIGAGGTPFYPRQTQETAKEYRGRTTFWDRLHYGFVTQPKETLGRDFSNLFN